MKKLKYRIVDWLFNKVYDAPSYSELEDEVDKLSMRVSELEDEVEYLRDMKGVSYP